MKQVLWVAGLAVATMAAAGCTKANPASCLDDHCSDPERPFCDADGSIGGEPDTCIAVDCAPGSFATCSDDRAVMCNATGNNYDVLDCEFGCSDEAGGCNACKDLGTCPPPTHIAPKFLPDVCDQQAGPVDLTVTASMTIDTSVDAVCTGGVILQTFGPAICVLRYRSVIVGEAQTLRLKGSRAAAIVADASITIDGTVDASADREVNGPGGGTVRSGGYTAGQLNGGGGAGFKNMGGSGALAGSVGNVNNHGLAYANPADGTDLVGGTQANGAYGGGGGGALAIISCRETVAVLGLVDVGGGGGMGGLSVLGELPAAGGGSGGYVALQGRMVTVTGEIYANGGGGGAGRITSGNDSGAAGEDGSRSAISGGGGGFAVSGAGHGGSGSSYNFGNVGHHGSSSTGSHGAGAGGGGPGFVQTFTPAGVVPVLEYRGVSPEFEPNRTVPMR